MAYLSLEDILSQLRPHLNALEPKNTRMVKQQDQKLQHSNMRALIKYVDASFHRLNT